MLKSGFNAGYPAFPEAIGEHIKKRRLDLGLLQKDVAKQLDTSEDTITNWENGRAQPQIHFYPKIISFLGYYPFEEIDTFSGKITQYRHMNGLTYKQMGKRVGVDGSTIASWETGKTVPNVSMIQHIYRSSNQESRSQGAAFIT